MTILAPTRFTEESTRAVNTAAALAKKRREPLVLAHVLPQGLLRSFSQLEAAASTALADEGERLKRQGVLASVATLHGKVEAELARCASESGARLAIIGDTARPYHPVLGGTLEKLMRAIDLPLLVVRDERPFEAWARGERKLKVMLALETHSESMVARDWVGKLAEYGELELCAARIWWPAEEYARRGLAEEEGHRALAQQVREETESMLLGLPHAVERRVRCEIGTGHVAEQLTALANEEHADLVVVGTHRRRGLTRLNGVSERVLETAPMSVACVPLAAPVADLGKVPSFRVALAATDLSEDGNRSITHALALVADAGTVHVMHVSPEPFSSEKEKGLVQRIAEVIPAGAESRGGRVVIHVRHGDPALQICAGAVQLSADVICVGARTRHTGLIDKLLEHAGKPVLIAAPQR